MQRQEHFRKKDKIAPAIKGASALNVVEFHNYDTTVLRDNIGKCSHKVALSGQEHLISPKGDEDVWVEKVSDANSRSFVTRPSLIVVTILM